MPRVDPNRWEAVRRAWETSDMSLSDAAAQLGVSVPTVSIRAKRDLWIKSDVVEVDRLNYTPQQMTEAAVRALVRAASQTYDIPSAVKAAALLLDRTLGRVVKEAEPMLSPALPAPEQKMVPMEEWQTARRFLYQEAARADALPSPD